MIAEVKAIHPGPYPHVCSTSTKPGAEIAACALPVVSAGICLKAILHLKGCTSLT